MDELHVELPCPHGLPRLHGNELGGLHQPVLLQLQGDEAGGEAGAVDGHIHLLEDVGDGPDVVLVAVGDEEAPDAGAVLDEIGHVGDDEVDAVHIVPGEGHAAVHHDNLAAVLIGGHVLADLVQTAQGDDFQFFCHRCNNSFELLNKVCNRGSKGHARGRFSANGRTQRRDVRCLRGPVSPAGVRSRHVRVSV